MRIAISGTHSVGKTTLVNELKKHLDLNVISEVARDYPRDITDDPEGEMNRQLNIFHSQLEQEMENYMGFISDRSTIDNAAYMIRALKIYGHKLSIRDYLLVVNNINVALNTMYSYDYLFYIPIEFPSIYDGFRSTDEVERYEIDVIISELLGDDKIIINGTLEERVKKVLEIINEN